MREIKKTVNGHAASNCFRGFTFHVSLVIFTFCFSLSAQETNFGTLPPPVTGKIVFDRDIRPVLETSCLRCHGGEKPRSHFRLDDRVAALNGGDDNSNDIVAGDSTNSLLIQYVARQVKDMEMPPVGKGVRWLRNKSASCVHGLTRERPGAQRIRRQNSPWFLRRHSVGLTFKVTMQNFASFRA